MSEHRQLSPQPPDPLATEAVSIICDAMKADKVVGASCLVASTRASIVVAPRARALMGWNRKPVQVL
ncbi:hypothetical protein RGR602_PC02185 (plasmid) [Rhizobium gallicum bv. gallicum R602sp]|uniref:Uncharacterized protein n=1 Tax=Rhizobium gallicum bv. gallicum R602sp TaxID=1041138 RepID=A0A0B4XHG7_9HYPH|nr:hypothetical protein RGR602_PC02185 [Rhizobium gallicum bv. gallicum R602sp]